MTLVLDKSHKDRIKMIHDGPWTDKDLMFTLPNGRTVFHLAVMFSVPPPVMRALIAAAGCLAGRGFNATDMHGRMPLHYLLYCQPETLSAVLDVKGTIW
jgi:hypothetical protein